MKRYGFLFEKAFTMENLYLAYIDARRGKRKKKACFEFEKNLGANLKELHELIHADKYVPDKYFKFIVYEPKKRLIYAPSFRDVVVQHAIYRVIYDIFDRSFISTSFACRVGYGTHKAARYVRSAMIKNNSNSYILKLDIRKFFYSINRDILRKLIERKIKDSRLVNMIMIFSYIELELGVPIGNLLSQLFALIYLNPLDHFVKRILMIKYYARYVDDFVLIGLSRYECLSGRNVIIKFLQTDLNLILSKSTIQKIFRGVNYCGYRMWKCLILIRKYNLYRFKKALNKNNFKSIVSFLGHAKYTDSIENLLRIIKKENFDGKNIQLPKSYGSIYDLLFI